MKTNNAESFNALLKKDRKFLILTIIEHIYNKLQQWFHCQSTESTMCTSVLTLAQEDKLFKTLEVVRKVSMKPLYQFHFSMRYGCKIGYIMDLNNNICPCWKFQLESFPYAHAVVRATHRGISLHSLCIHY